MSALQNASESFERVIAEASMHLVRTGDKEAAKEFCERAGEALLRAGELLDALFEVAHAIDDCAIRLDEEGLT